MLNFFEIYKGKYIDSNELENNFIRFIKKNYKKYNINDKSFKEIELSFNKPNINTFSLFYQNSKNVKNNYIEFIYKEKKYKLRLRKNLNDNYISFTKNKKDILNLIKNDTWEQKNILIHEDYLLYDLKFSEEFISLYNYNMIEKKKIRIYYVNSILLSNLFFTGEIRLKTELSMKNNDENFLLKYLDPYNFKNFLSFEIELKKDIDIDINNIDDIDKLKKSLNQILKISNGINYERFFLIYDLIYPKIKTNMETIFNILDLNYKKLLLMKKIDGEYIQFYIKNSYCYLIKNNILYEFSCNIKSDYEMIGSGEYIFNESKKKIFPFHFHLAKIKNKEIIFNSRLNMFNFCKDSIINDYNENYDIYIYIKEIYGPFDYKKDYLRNILDIFNKISMIPTDGIIISNNIIDKTSEILDLKLKKKNTIDLYTNLQLIRNNNENILNFNLFLFKKNEETNLIKLYKIFNVKIEISENLFYDYSISMLIYNDGNKNKVIPINFISEYFIDENTLIPRFDKTQSMIYKKNYGNAIEVIIKSIVIHKYKINFNEEQFINLINKNENELKVFINDQKKKFDNASSEEIKQIFNINHDNNIIENNQINYDINEYIKEPLNINKNWYKKNDILIEKSQLNKLSNYAKTMGLLLSVNPISNNDTYSNVICIYCGKGGDLGKFFNNNIQKIVGVDPSKISLEEFKKRANVYSLKSKNFNYKVVELCLEDKIFLTKLYKKIKIENTFDIIDIQLGLHFSLTTETETHIMNILTSLSNKNKLPKTKVLISVNDKDNILDLLNKNNIEKNQVLKLKIDNNLTYDIQLINDKIISIFYSSSMNQPMEEYLISKIYLIDLFNKYNFELIQTWTFDELIQDKYIYSELQKRYSNNSTKNFLNTISEINFENNNILEILKLLRYYIFEYKY